MTEDQLSVLVHEFYGRVREDEMLGPVFNYAISDWPHHLGKMVDFWSSVMLTTARYKGNPMMMHLKHVARIRPEMFDRWLALWRETASEVLDKTGAAAVTAKSERIAESLQLGMFFKIQDHAA
jgi:hemoglobin